MKRLFDIAVSAASLIVLAAPFALIAALIKLSSRGTVLYGHERIGQGGLPFTFYKFRTMRPVDGAQITVADDPRITFVGGILRRWKIDELPQLWNVLRGDMSIIGPRPEVERFVRNYTKDQRRILESRPGLAGFAQLRYPHEAEMLKAVPYPEETYARQLLPKKIAADLEYESCRTFWSDLRLLGEVILLSLGKSYRVDVDFKIMPDASPAPD